MAFYKGLILQSLEEFRREADSGVRQRGRQIYKDGGVKLVSFDGEYYEAKFKVESQGGGGKYDVEFSDMDEADAMEADCDCPSDYYPCKHAVAATYAL
ncbi:MAG: SWIM zinc finger domain-containing protein, partial [Spirosomaceae bacterium]|nr:SWIM zinc finger domain-containing protein [Spirosomataceae bacterium]